MSENLNVFFFETPNPNLTPGKKANFSQKIGKSFAQRGMDVIPKGKDFIPKGMCLFPKGIARIPKGI